MDQPIIKTVNLSKVYKTESVETTALRNINLVVSRGEFVAIMGPSGSGKSTLMHILGALDLPTTGQYILDGHNVESLGDDKLAEIRNRKIGFVFQAFNLLPRTTTMDNVKLPMVYANIDESEQEIRAKKYLTLVGLENRLGHTSNQLSGGQQQRVAIARALVMNPAMLLADEPTGNIATSQAQEIMEIFSRINRDEGHTIVMITHEPDIAAYAQRIIHVRDGEIIADETNGKKKIKSKQ